MKKSKKQKLRNKAAREEEADTALLEIKKKQEYLNSLLEEAEAAVDVFNYDEAEQKLNELLSNDPENIKALETLSGVLLEKCDYTEAQNLLKKCIELSPEIGFSKYFSMGQLSEEKESITFYNKGISILEKDLEDYENVQPSEKKDKKSLVRPLSNAYCSIAEIYMTDCCFEEDAEINCFNAIELALKSDPSNPEAYICLSNYNLVKEQTEEAEEAVKKSLSLWLPAEEPFKEAEASDELLIPSYDSRIKTSKLLIELKMFDEATNVLDGLVDEDDEVVEVWYLLGWMNYIHGDEYKLNAHYYFSKAKEVSLKTGSQDDCLEHIDELLEELSTLVNEEEDDKEEVEENDDWITSSDSENEMET